MGITSSNPQKPSSSRMKPAEDKERFKRSVEELLKKECEALFAPKIGESSTTESREKETEARMCEFMKGGGCKEIFTSLEDCVEEFASDSPLKCKDKINMVFHCLYDYPDYYKPILDIVKTMEDHIDKEGGETLKNCKSLESMVKKQDEEGRLNAAICCAPALAFGTWGLLEGKNATCYPAFMEKLSTCAKSVESRVEVDGRIVTRPGTTMEFSVTLVEQLFGKDKAAEVSGPLVMRSNPGDEYTITELNQTDWSFDNTPKILVPIADGSEEMEAVAIIDILRRAKANVVVAALGNTLEVVASRKVKLVADVLLDEAENSSYDLIVLPGGLGGAEAFASSEKLVNMLKKQAESNKPYGAICASPALVLEPNGFLKGKKATAFPAMCGKLADQSHIEHRVLVDGNLITSRGPGTSLEFALAIVEKFYGREKGLQLAKATLV
ncbi:hypothetical protein AALP_AAs54686U000400 [Arabis alpina]|uniref:GCK domain-containing protein n=1 Tax=Arabis alpina TaxID=50452 RepID=A0A087FZE1_ARAAL|nr:hypothetical protein AALP_AAs54686U000400 [Arabis alpina]